MSATAAATAHAVHLDPAEPNATNTDPAVSAYCECGWLGEWFHFALDPSDPETVIARALDDAETAAAEDGTGHLYDTA
jgi:hypothetical protein